MKHRLAILLVVLPLLVSQMAWGADAKQTGRGAEGVVALPFDKVAPLPGALAVSADGRIAAHIGLNGDIVIWDAARIKLLETIASGDRKPSAIALSPDGEMIAIGYFDARLVVRSRPEKRALREFYGHSGGISALAFSPDGQMLASGADDATTQLWEVATGKRLHVFDSMSNTDISVGSGIPVSIGFSGDGQALIVNEWYSRHYDVGRGITIWDIKEGIEISTRDVAPPDGAGDNAMRSGQALGGNGWLLTYTGGRGLMVERLDQCESPRQLPSGGYADTVAADPLGRWVAAVKYRWPDTAGGETKGEEITFFGTNNNQKTYAISLPAKTISLVPHPDGRSVFALMIADTRLNGNEHFIFGRDAETVTGSALYRILVPEPLRRLPPLSIKEDATHCAPTEAARMQQDFKVPENPLELTAIAKLVPPDVAALDANYSFWVDDMIHFPGTFYFGEGESFYAFYGASAGPGVAVWNLQTGRLLRHRVDPSYWRNNSTIRLRKGWGGIHWDDTQMILTDLLTGKRLSSVSNDDDKNDIFSLKSDPDTGQFFRQASHSIDPVTGQYSPPTVKHIKYYSADGRRLPNIATKGTIIDYAVRNGRLAALYESGNVEVLQLIPGGKSKTYKLGLNFSGDGDDRVWGGVEELVLSADGSYLQIAFPNASGDGPTSYVIYRLNSGKSVGYERLLSPFPARANRGVVYDTRPHHLAVRDYDKGEIIARLPRQRSRDGNGMYRGLRATLSDDGRLLASGSYDGLVRVWDLDAHQLIGEGRIGGQVTGIVFDSAGQRLAAGRRDGQITVFQIPAPAPE